MGRGSRKDPGPFIYLLLRAFDGLQDLVLAVELDIWALRMPSTMFCCASLLSALEATPSYGARL